MIYFMDAILKRMNKAVLFSLSWLIISCGHAQDCIKETRLKSDKKNIPKEVCIQPSYIIYTVFSNNEEIDFNLDGYSDYVFMMSKKSQNIGDSTYIVFYEMNQDSVFRFTKKLGNIYPIYFDPNIENPDLKDSNQQRLFDCYGLPDPLYSFDIKSDTISITRRLDGHNFERILYVYKYNSKLKDWVLVSKKKYSENESILYETENELLSNFSYCDEH